MKYQIVRTVLMCVACANSGSSIAAPQSGNKPRRADQKEAVTVASDRFSGKSKVTLHPQLLIDTTEQCLSVEAEVDPDARMYVGRFAGDASVMFMFMYSSNAPVDYGDQELHFLVDGAPVRVSGTGKTAMGIVPQNTEPAANGAQYRIKRHFFASIGVDALEEMLRGQRIEMRLGRAEFTLSAELTATLRKFVATAAAARKKYKE